MSDATAHAPAVILGGGPIGMACALLLARAGMDSHLVDARPVEALQRDRRLLALSQGSLLVLEGLLGAGFAPRGTISQVQVSSRGEFGSALLDARDLGTPRLGATVWYADLVQALDRAVAATPAIRVQRPRRALRVHQDAGQVRVELDDGSALAGAMAVDAEGTPPAPREAAQSALLAEVTLPGARPGEAFERFTREGPLALLPLPGGGDPQRLSMIWCLPTAVARERATLADGPLLELLAQALGARLGPAAALGPRALFPLHTHRLAQVREHRRVHLGNAAQTLHPVAGQGFNLGVRDCVALADAVRDAQGDALAALSRYERLRRADRRVIPALTGALPGLFASPLAPLALARGAALAALDVLPPARRALSRLLMLGTPR